MPFEPGNKFGKGRPKKVSRVIKEFLEAHPMAYDEVLDVLYTKGLEGNIDACKYVADRLRGTPRQTQDINVKDWRPDWSSLKVEMLEMPDVPRLEDGE